MPQSQHPWLRLRGILDCRKPNWTCKLVPVCDSARLCVLYTFPEVSFNAFGRRPEDIHRRVSARNAEVREFRIRGIDQTRCSPGRDDCQLVFKSFSLVEISLRELRQDYFLNCVEIENDYDPINWGLNTWCR